MLLLPNSTLLPIENLFYALFDHYLYTSICLTFISEIPLYVQVSISFTFLVPNNTTEGLMYQILPISEMGCSDYIVLMRHPEDFMVAFEKVVHMGNSRRSDRKIIFLPYLEGSSNSNCSTDLLEVLSMKESSFVANILLALPVEDHLEGISFDLVTHKYVGLDSEVYQPLYLDRWNSITKTFEKNVNLFPNDIRNLQGKTVRVGCFTYKPYVLLNLDTAISPLDRDGMEMRIIDEFCRWVNCTVEVVNEEEGQWGELYDNQTGIGVIGSVVEDRADFGISALYSWYEEYRMLDFSVAGIRTAITCLAPSPRLLPSWELPFLPFSWYMWYAVILTFIFASIGLIIAKRCSADQVFLTVFGILISQSHYSADSTWKVRRVTGWLLITGLILASAYGGGLASSFTIPKYEPSIDTVQDLVDRKLEWGATHDAWIFSLTLSKQPLVKQLVSQFKTYTSDQLKKKSFTRSMAYSIEKLPAGYFAIGEYLTREALLDMTIMLEDFYYENCVVMLRKSSVYTERISELIGRLHQSGLIHAWETQVALKHLDYKVQLEVKLSRSKGDVGTFHGLSLQDLLVFYI
uniref:Antennal ionotropic receptor 41a-2 n=2 Tax=Dendrolimus punctatus TaxID=238572 RepID=A0A2K8GL74_9NEOP|nr:antennal ionotropic receptor 41a-2 [Dendrolimus punctatus]